MKLHLVILLLASSLTGCLSTQTVDRPRVELGHRLLLIPPFSAAKQTVPKKLGRYSQNEAVAISAGQTRYAGDIEGLEPVLQAGNLFADGILNRKEVLGLARSVDCRSVGIIKVLERETLPPQRINLQVLWLRALDGAEYTNRTLELDMSNPETRAHFATYVRQESDAEVLIDKLTGNGTRFVSDTAMLSPDKFTQYAAAMAVRTLIDAQSPLRLAEIRAAESERAAILAAAEKKAYEEKVHKEMEEARNAVAELERRRRLLEAKYEAERKRLEAEALERKQKALAAARALAEGQEEFLARADENADMTKALALQAAGRAKDKQTAELNRTIATYASRFYQNAKRLRKIGDNPNAIEDLHRAVRLMPNFAWAHYLLGIIYFEQKRYEMSANTFDRVIKTGDNNLLPYAHLRAYLAGMHAVGDNEELALYAEDTKLKRWPKPIIDMFLDELTPEECLNKAAHANPKIAAGQKCSAHYYIGELFLLKGNVDASTLHFRRAAGIETDWAERDAARLRLGIRGK